jgi:hypothetical protein
MPGAVIHVDFAVYLNVIGDNAVGPLESYPGGVISGADEERLRAVDAAQGAAIAAADRLAAKYADEHWFLNSYVESHVWDGDKLVAHIRIYVKRSPLFQTRLAAAYPGVKERQRNAPSDN